MEEDNFTSAVIEAEPDGGKFDANQYSFFGDYDPKTSGLDDGLEGLEGALEDGLDAPPEEEGLLGGLEDEPLQGLNEGVSHDLVLDEDRDVRGLHRRAQGSNTVDQSFADLLSQAVPPELLNDDEPPPPTLRLLQQSQGQQQQQPGSAFSSIFPGLTKPPPPTFPPGGSLLGAGGPSQLTPSFQQLPTTIAPEAPPQNPLFKLFQKPPQPAPAPTTSGPMTAEQLEARMLANAGQMAPPAPPPAPIGAPRGFFSMQPQPPMQQQMQLQRPPPGMPGHPGVMGMGMPGHGPPSHSMHGRPMGPGMMYPQHQQGMPGGMRLGMGPGMMMQQPGGPGRPMMGQMQRMPGPHHMQPPPMRMQGPNAMGPGHFQGGMMGPGQPHARPVRPFNYRDALGPGMQQDNGGMRREQQPLPVTGRRPGAKMMSSDEIDYIMRIMYNAVNGGVPYVEDYYYQAFVNKHRAAKNRATFAPMALRDLTGEAAKLDPSASVRFVPAEGLGKIVYSNIRTPKVLMDLSVAPAKTPVPVPAAAAGVTAGAAAEEGADASSSADATPAAAPAAPAAPARPLEQEPLLAARIMVEDCVNLLMDVDDIDRLLASGSPLGKQDPEALQQRRALLLAGITLSFRLPAQPDAADPIGDGVFMRIMALPKGRSMLARTLRLLDPAAEAVGGSSKAEADVDAVREDDQQGKGQPSPLQLLWAMLRNSWELFSAGPAAAASASGPGGAADPGAERSHYDSTVRVVHASREAIRKFVQPKQVLDCLSAFLAGCKQHMASAGPSATLMDTVILPLVPTRTVPPALPGVSSLGPEEWLGELLAALMSSAETLGVATKAQEQWQPLVGQLFGMLTAHLEALLTLHNAAVASQNAELLAMVKSLACKPLMQAVMALVDDQQRSQLRDLLIKFLA